MLSWCLDLKRSVGLMILVDSRVLTLYIKHSRTKQNGGGGWLKAGKTNHSTIIYWDGCTIILWALEVPNDIFQVQLCCMHMYPWVWVFHNFLQYFCTRRATLCIAIVVVGQYFSILITSKPNLGDIELANKVPENVNTMVQGQRFYSPKHIQMMIRTHRISGTKRSLTNHQLWSCVVL